MDDLEGGGLVLDTGQVCHLPLIPLEGTSPCCISATHYKNMQPRCLRPPKNPFSRDIAQVLHSVIVLSCGMVSHAGIVLMPGDTLPLRVVRQQDRAKLETALNAPAPYTRLIAVVHIL